MKKKLTTLFLMAAACVIFLPATGAGATAGDGRLAVAGLNTENLVLQQRRGRGRGGRDWDRRRGGRDWDRRGDRYWDQRGRRRSGSWYGYRNYGQYRRTQVGNRRYRTERRYIWRDGRRVSVWRRIFY